MRSKSNIKFAARIFFLVYLAVLFYLLFFSEFAGRTEIYEEYHYNLTPFATIRRYLIYSKVGGYFVRLVNVEGNILAFLPFGFFLPLLWRRCRKVWLTVLLTACFSIIVEVLQLFTRVGSCDIDDVILNTLGGVIGYLLYLLIAAIFGRVHGKKKV